MVPTGGHSRRAFLAGATAAVGGLAGCGDVDSGRPGTPSATPTDPSRPVTKCLEESTLADYQPSRPYSDPSGIEPVPDDCPQVESPQWQRICERGLFELVCDDWERPEHRIVCTATAEEAPLRTVAERRRLELPGRIGFTVVNGTDTAFQTNFYDWLLWKRVAGRWYHVAPASHPSPLHTLEPGAIQQYCVRMGNTSLEGRRQPRFREPDGDPETNRWGLAVPGLGGGEYAFGLFGWLEGAQDPDRQLGLVTKFSPDGDPVEVTPTGLVENVSRTGDAVTGEWTYGHDGDDGEPHEFELRRIGRDRQTIRLLPEEFLRKWSRSPIRDMVALSRRFDADVVRVRATNYAMIAMAPPYVPFEYDGQGYETSVRER